MKNIFLVTISLFFISGKVFSQTDFSLKNNAFFLFGKALI